MTEKKRTQYVNVFQGNGEIDLPKPEGIAATWRFLKAQCGNTNPFASYPFGRITCGPYTGGYPTGYGNHMPNSCGGIRKFCAKVKGFSHLHQSGTGGIRAYYNYALVSPLYGALREMEEEIVSEAAEPGFYSATLKISGIRAEIAVSETVAYHRYHFSGSGTVRVDFSNGGLDKRMGANYFVRPSEAEMLIQNGFLCARIVMQGVPLYFAVQCEHAEMYLWEADKRIEQKRYQTGKTEKTFGGAFLVKNTCEVRVCVSLIGFEEAILQLTGAEKSIDEVRKKTSEAWERVLSAVTIQTEDERLKEIFYSNLYHSFIKPAKWGEIYMDFATMWDLYKTQLPLVFTLFSQETEEIMQALLHYMEKNVPSPISVTLAEGIDMPNQARMLMEYALADGYYRSEKADRERILRAAYADFKAHAADLKDGVFPYYTHVLDVSGACAAMAEMAKQTGDTEKEWAFLKGTDLWRHVFDLSTGLLSEQSEYYEGDNWNYSFRLLPDMQARIALTGGKERFVSLLDEFFGYTREPVKQLEEPEGNAFLEGVHSFEGFNNEPDMETPYNYIYAGRQDKTCEILRAGMQYMFADGIGGLPGNNDSGGLSSCYVWNVLGIFPVSGQNQMLIGSPLADGAVLRLANGNTFEIRVRQNSAENIYVQKAVLNGRELENAMFSVTEMMKGGLLELYMADSPQISE